MSSFLVRLIIVSLLLIQCTECLSSDNKRRLDIVSTNRNGGHTKVFHLDADGNPRVDPSSSSATAKRRIQGLQHISSVIRSTFLPSGYPTRTPSGYLQYSAWSWIQDLSTQLRSVLATQRVLEGVGVGREGATAISALMNYLVRDGCGMAANLLFTSGWSTCFRTDIKRWRLFADTILDVGITCEVAAVLVPQAFFLPMISIGNICKSICGVAAGACGGAINLHWAKGSDISDINAKFGAQHTCTGALGLVFAALFARSVNQTKPTVLWSLYFLLTFIHIFANTRCMKLISFDYCNNTRLDILLAEFFSKRRDGGDTNESLFQKLPTPTEVSRTESLFFGVGDGHRGLLTSVPFRFGVDFEEFHQASRGNLPMQSDGTVEFDSEKYIITAGMTKRNKKCIAVSFLSDASPRDVTKAYFHAMCLAIQIQKGDTLHSLTDIQDLWNPFEALATKAGWDLDKTELRSEGFELTLHSNES
ncbi:unnamed protein product [Cylindrotheca closterium]|uniref:Uncharacterized protein n=1 Tax=Cylindrotheca closterium TaxID=2856 RepID=A0AAD2FQH3_9STRA|nr:unnamed protein product [Cylindrotheca closterium]